LPLADYRILVVNPGSVSTKFAVYGNERAELVRNLRHSDEEMAQFQGRPVLEQRDFRLSLMERELIDAGYTPEQFHAVAGRGGLLRPLASGTYRVNDLMLEELRLAARGNHASNLGAVLASAFAQQAKVEAFIVDPVSVDERPPHARLSGSSELERIGLSHALNSKAIAKRYAREQLRSYDDLRLVVAHLGSGFCVSAHMGGKMVDMNNAREEGAFAAERSGTLPALALVRLCYSGTHTQKQAESLVFGEGGLYSYLGTKDLAEVERRVAAGDAKAALVFDAMIYQIAKDIGAMATVLHGRIDAVLITGGMAHSQQLIEKLSQSIAWIAPVSVYPGEDELQALAEGVLRVLRGEERAREFGAPEPVPQAAFQEDS
jgi:butyrate kinase